MKTLSSDFTLKATISGGIELNMASTHFEMEMKEQKAGGVTISLVKTRLSDLLRKKTPCVLENGNPIPRNLFIQSIKIEGKRLLLTCSAARKETR